MSTKTDEQLAGMKKHKSLTPVAKATRARARKSEGDATAAAGTKAGRSAAGKPGKKGGAAKKSGTQKVRSKPAGIPEEAPGDSAAERVEASGLGAESENAAGGYAHENGGDPIKPLTEAGKKRLVNKLLGLADSQATQGAFKITPADLIRLMQLHKEMNPQKNRKVTVQWIEDKPE